MQDFEALKRQTERVFEIANELLSKRPELGVSAYIIANDMQSAEYADERVRNGEKPKDIWRQIGSYARFDWCVKNLTHAHLMRILPGLWVGSDADDTNYEYLKLWEEAYKRNGNRIIYDCKNTDLDEVIEVHRGQSSSADIGFSWTTDVKVARKFALTGGLRTYIKDGILYTMYAKREDILAYLTSRNEAEVIIHPAKLLRRRPKKT